MDITLALNVHSESVVAGPTLASAHAAVKAARARGFDVEMIVGLDNPTDECRAYFERLGTQGWRVIELEAGDLGLARNGLVEVARGHVVAFLDADDLLSENWLAEGSAKILADEAAGIQSIMHPELNLFFDAAGSCMGNRSDDDPLFTSSYWQHANYYDSLAMATRRTFEEIPYVGRDKERGFGYEDWRWNLDTMDAGWRHSIVKDTIIFKRRRDVSLLSELGSKKTLLWSMERLSCDKFGTAIHSETSGVQDLRESR